MVCILPLKIRTDLEQTLYCTLWKQISFRAAVSLFVGYYNIRHQGGRKRRYWHASYCHWYWRLKRLPMICWTEKTRSNYSIVWAPDVEFCGGIDLSALTSLLRAENTENRENDKISANIHRVSNNDEVFRLLHFPWRRRRRCHATPFTYCNQSQILRVGGCVGPSPSLKQVWIKAV